MLTLKTPTVKKNAFGLKNANDNANAKPKRAESPTLYSPIRKGWVSVGQKDKNTLAHNPKGCAVETRRLVDSKSHWCYGFSTPLDFNK